jgi:hypothetical protein
MLKKNHRPWLLAIGVVPLALTLTGCFGAPSLPGLPGSDGGSDDVDEIVEGIVEGSGEGIDFESGSLPSDFPVDAVPLVDGEFGPSMSISDSQAWTVVVYTADEETARSAPDLLEAAGFSNESGIFWETDEYLVVITGTGQDDDDRWYVGYQVQVQQ